MRKPEENQTPDVSKSQRKREAQEMLDLGRRLVDMPASSLRKLPLEADLLEAVEFTRSIKSRVARKRQLGFLAKLLRMADTTTLTEALERMHGAARESNARHHRTEAWRDMLLERGDKALSVLASNHEHTDAQAIRQLVRNAERESRLGKPPAAARKLFKLLRDLDEKQPLPPTPL